MAVTPNPLHFVRNHGGIPRIEKDKWNLKLDGLVKNPMTLTLDDIMDESRFPRMEKMITIQCCGTRRIEQIQLYSGEGDEVHPRVLVLRALQDHPVRASGGHRCAHLLRQRRREHAKARVVFQVFEERGRGPDHRAAAGQKVLVRLLPGVAAAVALWLESLPWLYSAVV